MRGAPLQSVASAADGEDRAQTVGGEFPPPGVAPSSARYGAAVKDLAVSEVERRRLLNPRDRTVYREVARQFGVGEQSLRLWMKKRDAERLEAAEPAAGSGDVMSPEQMHSELQALRRQIQKLRTENDVLKRAFVVFSSEWGHDK